MKYKKTFLLQQEGHLAKVCCKLFGVSYSGFHKWKGRPLSKRKIKDKELKPKILSFFETSKETYGSPRIQKQLEREGEKIGKNRVARLMREEDLSARQSKSFLPKTTLNNPKDKKSPREFKIESCKVSRSSEVWVSDLTYIPTDKGFVYLVAIMDLFNREIVGWNVSESMEASHTKRALIEALKRVSGSLDGLIFHSDQGIQYCSKTFREKLDFLGITQSMSRKGNCYDNAFMESFFHTLKNELPKKKFRDLEEVRGAVFEYIEP